MRTVSLLLVLLAGWAIFSAVLCEPLGGPDPQHEFLVSIKIFPEKAEYKVGDTLWLEIKIPNNKLLDTWSEDSILLENASIPLDFLMAENLYKLPFDSTVATFFVEDPVGSFLLENTFESSLRLNTGFGCGQDPIRLLLQIHLKKPGIYSIRPHPYDSSVLTFGSAFDCLTATGANTLAFLKYIFEVQDAHQAIYDKVVTLPNPHTFVSGELSMEALIFGKRIYWFEVVE